MKKLTKLFALAAALTFGAAAQAETIEAGTIANDGSLVTFDAALDDSGDLDFFNFNITGDVNDGDGTYLNIQTLPDAAGNIFDTEIALYDSLGMLVAFDDDGNANNPPAGFLLSLLSFGDADPFPCDCTAGEDGSLLAGMYTLVVGGFNTLFTADINNITAGNAFGGYQLQFAHISNDGQVPEPAAILLLALGLLGLRQLRK